ncbi:DUF5959 family protein [Kitasatospora sp. NPDC101183]|uniref:DUF5959 family protein n=1 Tax=Kitasatospora sp. NPDC101183 TaxID=3364100 RepID=UPI0038297697
MGDSAPQELISRADDEGNSVTVNVLGPSAGWSAGLDAEIVVKTPFVAGRVDLALYVSKPIRPPPERPGRRGTHAPSAVWRGVRGQTVGRRRSRAPCRIETLSSNPNGLVQPRPLTAR